MFLERVSIKDVFFWWKAFLNAERKQLFIATCITSES